MPTYHIRDTETDEVYEEFCTYDELQEWLKETNEYNDVEEKEEDFYFKEIIIID